MKINVSILSGEDHAKKRRGLTQTLAFVTAARASFKSKMRKTLEKL